MITESVLLTPEELAEMIGMTPQWVCAQCRRGRIPHIKLGRFYKFRREAIEAWLASEEC